MEIWIQTNYRVDRKVVVGRELFRPALQEKPKLPRKVRAGRRNKIPWNLEGQFLWLEIVFLKRSIGGSKHSEIIWNYNLSKNLGLHKMIHLFWCFSCLVNVDFGTFDQPSKVREARRESRRVLVSHWCSRGGCTVWSTIKQHGMNILMALYQHPTRKIILICAISPWVFVGIILRDSGESLVMKSLDLGQQFLVAPEEIGFFGMDKDWTRGNV